MSQFLIHIFSLNSGGYHINMTSPECFSPLSHVQIRSHSTVYLYVYVPRKKNTESKFSIGFLTVIISRHNSGLTYDYTATTKTFPFSKMSVISVKLILVWWAYHLQQQGVQRGKLARRGEEEGGKKREQGFSNPYQRLFTFFPRRRENVR